MVKLRVIICQFNINNSRIVDKLLKSRWQMVKHDFLVHLWLILMRSVKGIHVNYLESCLCISISSNNNKKGRYICFYFLYWRNRQNKVIYCTSCGGTPNVIVRRSTFWYDSMHGRTKNIPWIEKKL